MLLPRGPQSDVPLRHPWTTLRREEVTHPKYGRIELNTNDVILVDKGDFNDISSSKDCTLYMNVMSARVK